MEEKKFNIFINNINIEFIFTNFENVKKEHSLLVGNDDSFIQAYYDILNKKIYCSNLKKDLYLKNIIKHELWHVIFDVYNIDIPKDTDWEHWFINNAINYQEIVEKETKLIYDRI